MIMSANVLVVDFEDIWLRRGRTAATDGDATSLSVPEEAAFSVPDDIAAMRRDLTGGRERSSAFRFATVVSTAAHLLLAGYMMLDPIREDIGVGGEVLEAVSVDIITGAALEALLARPESDGGAAQAVDAHIGTATTTFEEQAPQAPPNEARESEAKPEAPVKPEENLISEPDVTVAEARHPVEERFQDKPDPQEVEQGPPTEARAASIVGASSASSSATAGGSNGQSAASAGRANRYAMEVRAALGRARPRHSGIKGSVWIKFAIDQKGAVVAAEVSRTSGSQRLDALALGSIRAARLPMPPPGLNDLQRTYVVPFDFR